MPNSQNAQQGTAADSGAVYSPRLCNEDLAPTRDQNWSWYNIFSFWMSDVHSMGGYVVAASFFTLGLASWQVLLCLLVGICIVQLCANLVAKPSQMAGVPYAVKNLFDVAGLPTLAGSKIERDAAPASADATLVRRMHAAGAVLVGALNMDEFAYGFTTENSHYGPARNPHDLACVAGGSSGGSGAGVGARFL